MTSGRMQIVVLALSIAAVLICPLPAPGAMMMTLDWQEPSSGGLPAATPARRRSFVGQPSAAGGRSRAGNILVFALRGPAETGQAATFRGRPGVRNASAKGAQRLAGAAATGSVGAGSGAAQGSRQAARTNSRSGPSAAGLAASVPTARSNESPSISIDVPAAIVDMVEEAFSSQSPADASRDLDEPSFIAAPWPPGLPGYLPPPVDDGLVDSVVLVPDTLQSALSGDLPPSSAARDSGPAGPQVMQSPKPATTVIWAVLLVAVLVAARSVPSKPLPLRFCRHA